MRCKGVDAKLKSRWAGGVQIFVPPLVWPDYHRTGWLGIIGESLK
jgi:hypothetical protein